MKRITQQSLSNFIVKLAVWSFMGFFFGWFHRHSKRKHVYCLCCAQPIEIINILQLLRSDIFTL